MSQNSAFFAGISWSPILITFELAAITSLILMLIGTPAALWLAHTKNRAKPLFESLVALPLVLPPTVLGFYLLILLGQDGWLGALWQQWTGHVLAFSFTGLVIGSVFYSLPFAIQPLQSAFEAIDKNLYQAAASLRAGPFDRFLSITMPLARRGFLTAFVLSFAHTIGEFGVVLMIGGNIEGVTQVLSIAIYEHEEAHEYTQAHILSVGLLIFSLSVLFLVNWMNRRWSHDT